MKILITGGSGFIGSHVIRKIQKNHQIIACSRNQKVNKKNLLWIKCSIDELEKNKNRIINFKPECLIHLAWEGIPNFTKSNCNKNFIMSKKFVAFLIKFTKIKKIIISGTCFEYKEYQGECTENNKIIPKSYFIKSKIKLLKFVKEKVKNTKIKFYWLRLFYVYGPNQRKDSLIPHCINSLKKGRIPKIKNPDNINDFVYVDDVAIGIKKILKNNPKSGIYNIGSGKPKDLKTIVELIAKIFSKKKFLFNYKKNTKEKLQFWSNNKKIKKYLNWEPKTTLEIGLKKTIRSYKLLNK